MKNIICISGRIASGKSTLAHALVENLTDAQIESFGDVVRQEALAANRSLDRESLQEIGLNLVKTGWPNFVDKLLNDVAENPSNLVIDGVRHIEAIEEIKRRQIADKVLVVFIETDSDTVGDRLTARGERLSSLNHSVESEIDKLKDIADIIIDGGANIQENLDKIVRSLK